MHNKNRHFLEPRIFPRNSAPEALEATGGAFCRDLGQKSRTVGGFQSQGGQKCSTVGAFKSQGGEKCRTVGGFKGQCGQKCRTVCGLKGQGGQKCRTVGAFKGQGGQKSRIVIGFQCQGGQKCRTVGNGFEFRTSKKGFPRHGPKLTTDTIKLTIEIDTFGSSEIFLEIRPRNP